MKIIVFVIAVLLAGCAGSTKDQVEFKVSVDEMTAAIYKFRNSESHVLYLFMVNREGDIVRAEYLESQNTKLTKQEILTWKYKLKKNLKYTRVKESEPEYREIFHAVKHSMSTSFE